MITKPLLNSITIKKTNMTIRTLPLTVITLMLISAFKLNTCTVVVRCFMNFFVSVDKKTYRPVFVSTMTPDQKIDFCLMEG